MTANLWMSLTMKIMTLGHTLRDVQHLAAVILIGRLGVYTIMGYRLPADEPERIPVDFTITRESGTGGIDRDGVPFVDGKPIGKMPPASGDTGSPAPASAASVSAGSGGVDPPDHLLRWLAKQNAIKAQAAEKDGTTGSPIEVPVVEAPWGEGILPPGEEGGGGVKSTEAISASDYPFFRHF